MSDSRYPYAQMAANRHQRRKNLVAIFAARGKVEFDLGELKEDSSIIVVNESVGQKLVEYFHKHPKELELIDRRRFEELVAELFDGFGYTVELTSKTRDGGKDIIAISKKNQIATKYLIECKRPNPGNPVGVGVVRELMGVKVDEKATKAILATTTYFTPDAQLFEERNMWELELKEFEGIIAWIDTYITIKRTV